MSASAKLNRAPSELTLFDKDGTERKFQMRALNDRTLTELDEWLRSKFLAMTRKSLRDDPEVTEHEYRAEMSIAQERAPTITFMHGIGPKMIATVDGMTQLLFLSIRENHPKMTVEKLRKLMFSQANIAATRKKFAQLNNRKLEKSDVDTGQGGPAAGKKQSQQPSQQLRQKRLQKKKHRQQKLKGKKGKFTKP